MAAQARRRAYRVARLTAAPESSRPVPAPDSRRASVLLADLVVILTGCAQSVSYDKAFSLALGTRGGGLGTIPGGQQVGPGHQARADERAHDRVLRVAAAVGTVLPGRPGSSAAPRLAGGLAVARPLARRGGGHGFSPPPAGCTGFGARAPPACSRRESGSRIGGWAPSGSVLSRAIAAGRTLPLQLYAVAERSRPPITVRANTRRSARQLGHQCDRLCRARTGRSVAQIVWARWCCPRCWPRAASVNPRLASNFRKPSSTPLLGGPR